MINEKILEACEDIKKAVTLAPDHAYAIAQHLYIEHQMANSMSDSRTLNQVRRSTVFCIAINLVV